MPDIPIFQERAKNRHKYETPEFQILATNSRNILNYEGAKKNMAVGQICQHAFRL